MLGATASLRVHAEFLKIRQGKARDSPKRGCRHFSTSGFFAQHKLNRSRAPQPAERGGRVNFSDQDQFLMLDHNCCRGIFGWRQ
jgi:hypothetical protein